MNFKFFAKIIRPFNCIMASIAVFIGYSVAINGIAFEVSVLLAMLAAFFICAGGQVINDFFDVKIDEKIRPEKTLPSKKMSMRTALFYAVILFLFGLGFAFLINDVSFIIAVVFTTILIFYSAFIQKQKFFGNIVVALGTAFTLIFGASTVQSYGTVIFLAASAFFANMGREITKDMQDKKADKGFKKSLPMVLSEKQINQLVLLFYIIAVEIAFYVWLAGFFSGVLYLILMIISAIVFFYSFSLLRKKMFGGAQVFSKIAMAVSLIAFLSGVF